MLTTTLMSALLFAPHAQTVTAEIKSASLFKNGFAVVMREITVPAAGAYVLDSIPRGSLGTIWFTAVGGAKLDGVETTSIERNNPVEAGSIDALLADNVGKQVVLGLQGDDAVTGRSTEGKLISASGDIVLLSSEKGMLALRKSNVTSISAKVDGLNTSATLSISHKGLEFHTKGGAGKIQMLSLERGLTWTPSYAIDVSEKKTLRVTAKATVLNDLEDLNSVDAKFVTGFPNVPYAMEEDPLTSSVTAEQFAGLVPLNTSLSGGFGGGVGAGGGRGRGQMDMLTQNAYAAAAAPAIGEGVSVSPAPGEQLEDLFFYQEPDLTLAKGDRAYKVLFRMEAPYEDIYTWDIDDNTTNNVEYRPEGDLGEVWHTLKFENTSGQPFTTGPATTFKDGQVIGQDTMHFVSTKATAEIRVTKALDIHAEVNEEEVTRERGAIKNAYNNSVFDLVTLKGTMEVTNYKPETVKLRIKKEYTGEFVAADGIFDIQKTAKGLLQTNPTGRLTWNLSFTAGEHRKLSYTYKMYVRSQ